MLIESAINSDLDINQWLINWGLLKGEYKDEIFTTTKFGLINNWFSFWVFLLALIKWATLMFCEKQSKIAYYLGEWGDWFGPKLVLDAILSVQPFNSLILWYFVFYYASKNSKKLLFWLDFMQFDNESRCFTKLDLNETDSKKYIKQFAMSRVIVKHICYSVTYLSMLVLIVSLFYFENRNHFLYHFIYILLHWNVLLFKSLVWFDSGFLSGKNLMKILI